MADLKFEPTSLNVFGAHVGVEGGMTLLEFRRYVWRQKTRVPGLSLSYGFVCVILRLAILACDRQTDGRTTTAYTGT